MKKQLIIAACAVFVISACSSSSTRERATGGYDYMESEERDIDLKVPEELESPQISNQYQIPELISDNQSSIIGDNVKISSPRLVLPLVAGSNVDEGSKQAKVNFDQTNDSRDLDKNIWDKVLSYLEKNSIGVSAFDRDQNELVTDWVISVTEVDTSWYEFSDETIEQAKKFKLSLDLAPHGRTASLTSEIVEYIDESGQSAISDLDPITKRNNEVNFLNYIIAEYDFGVRLAQTQRIAKIREGFNSNLGFNADGDSAITVDANFNDAWPRLLLVLRKIGFDVIDLDQSSGIMFVIYNGSEDGFWSGLFSSDELPLDEDNYRIFVERAGNKTNVTFKNDESVSFDAKKTTDIFPVFRDYMASDNLDI